MPPPEVPGKETPGAGEGQADEPAGPPPAPALPQAPAAEPASPTWPSAPPAGVPARPWPEAPASTDEPATQWPEAPATRHGPRSVPARADERLLAAAPDDPFYLSAASWRWPAAIIGLLVASAPETILQVSALIAGGTPTNSEPTTTAGAIAVAVSALVLYSWQTLAAWLFSLRTSSRSLVLWGFRRPTRAYFWVVPLGLTTAYAVGAVHDIIVHPEQQAIVSAFPHTTVGAAMFIVVAVVIAPAAEEILFRGFLFRGIANSLGWVWGATLSAAIFGAAHVQLDVFVPLAALGFILAWAYHRTGSLWTSITMHVVFNTIAVLTWAFLT